MKRFMKGCGITALIFAALGFVLALAGGSVAGNSMIADVVESATGGKIHMDRYGWWWGINMGDRTINEQIDVIQQEVADEFARAVDYGWSDTAQDQMGSYTTVQDSDPMFNRKYDIITGSRGEYCPGDNIQKLDIEIAGCRFYTGVSWDDQIYLNVYGAYRFQAYVKDGTLHIKAKSASVSDWAEGGEITLYLPAGYHFQDVDMELEAGEFLFENLNAAKVSLEVGAGQADIQNVETADMNISVGAGYVGLWEAQITKLDVELGMGAFSINGAVNGDIDIDCSMGNVDMTLEGREQDFDYCLEGAMGNIELNGNSYGGLAQELEINNHAAKEMDIECSMGSVIITFLD